MRQETSEKTDTLIHITKPRDVSAVMEMHASGFGTSGTDWTGEGEGAGGQAGEVLESKEEERGLHLCGCHWDRPLQRSGLSQQKNQLF